MTKEEAKTKIADLIERYNSLSSSEIKLMNEETTKAKFIRPLFEVLGWDFEQDVNLEEKISNGRVDYNFQIFFFLSSLILLITIFAKAI